MSKPDIWWSGNPTDGIYDVFRESMIERGYRFGVDDSHIVAFSAGDPFWRRHPHNTEVMRTILRQPQRKVMIFERHEFGWCNYTPALRAQNAWMGVPEYGRDTDVGGGKHADGHAEFARFVRALTVQRDMGRKFIYLRREYFRDFPYPEFVHPASFHVTCSPGIPSFDEWKARPFDVVCIWGETHPHRAEIAAALRRGVAAGLFTADIRSPVYQGDEGRTPNGEAYREAHRRGRIFIEADGHGLGGGRSWELITTLAMARKRSHMAVRHDWSHGHSCLEFGAPDDPGVDELVATIADWVRRPQELYDLFRRGHGHANAWHGFGKQAEYLEGLMAKHGFFD